MHIPSQLKLRLVDATQRALAKDAQNALRRGRECIALGQDAEAMAHFKSAIAIDGRAYCRPWGLETRFARPAPALVRRCMKNRLAAWYSGQGPQHAPAVAKLADKAALRAWGQSQDIVRLPRQLGLFARFADIPWSDFARAAVVIKPLQGAMARGVLVLDDGHDLMRQMQCAPDLAGYAARVWEQEQVNEGPFLVEELVRDSLRLHDPKIRIPRDFKGFCALGKVAIVTVQDTNAPGGYTDFRSRQSFDAQGRILPGTNVKLPNHGSKSPPVELPAVIAAMERLSAVFPLALRFDFYHDDSGPVLGEITHYPNAGLNYSPFAARTFIQMLVVTGELPLPARRR